MARKVDFYRSELRGRRDWEAYLESHSGLPGPRANLELVEAVGDEADAGRLWRLAGSADEFLALCGAAGLGRFAGTDPAVLPRLRELASDPRWRVREGVAIGLQRLGRESMPRLLAEMDVWSGGGPYVQRAAAAGLCEPALLKQPDHVRGVLAILDRITESMTASGERSAEDFRVLRQAMGYCWSVAAVPFPDESRALLEKWLRAGDRDVAWVMKSNLGKARMAALGADWLSRWRGALQAPTPPAR